MGVRHRAARALVEAFPTDVGLWRLRPYLPACPRPGQLFERELRGFPLRLKFYPGTYAGWFLFYRGLYEEGCVKAFARLLRPGMTVVDVGANYGMYSTIAAHVVGPSGRVLAVEPQDNLAELVADNARLNGLGNVTVAGCALGTRSGRGRLHQPSRSNDGQATLALLESEKSFGDAEVAVKTLPDLLAEQGLTSVNAMKIDVEGGELRALEGAASLFAAIPPEFVLFECIDSHLARFGDSASGLLDFFLSRGYQVRGLHRGRWHPIARLEDHRAAHHTSDLIALRPGIEIPRT